ncbi:MAG: ATP-binding cassette domain-containing protein, partial [Bdellovibrionales bacterium]
MRADDFGQNHVWDVHTRISNRALAAKLFSFAELWERSLPLPALGDHARRAGNEDQFMLTALHAVCHHRAEWDPIWLNDGKLLLDSMNAVNRQDLIKQAQRKKIGGLLGIFLEKIENLYGPTNTILREELKGGEAQTLYRWAVQPPGHFALLFSDGWRQESLRAKLRFFKGLLVPTREYKVFHRISAVRRIMRALTRQIPALKSFAHYHSQFRKYASNHLTTLAAISLFSTFSEGVGISIFVAYLEGANYLKQYSPGLVVLLAVTLVGMRAAVQLGIRGYRHRLHTRLTARFTQELSKSIAQTPYCDFAKQGSAEWFQLSSVELPRAVNAFYQLSSIPPAAAGALTYLAMSLRLDWAITLLAAVSCALAAVTSRKLFTSMAAASQRLSTEELKLNSLFVQMLQSFKYLLSTASLPKMQKRIEKQAAHLADQTAQMAGINAALPILSEVCMIGVIGIIVYIHIELRHGQAAPLLICILFLYRAIREFTQLQAGWLSFHQFAGGVDALFNQFTKLPKAKMPPVIIGDGTLPTIEMKNITFSYGHTPVLENFSIKFPAGQLTGLAGPSGAGKSTVVDMLTGLLVPSNGQILINGENLSELDLQSWRAQTGYVTQENIIFDDTIANNISLWNWTNDGNGRERVEQALAKAGCSEFVKKLAQGADSWVGERGVFFSGGER